MTFLSEALGISPATEGKLIASVLAISVIVVARWLILRTMDKRFEEAWVSYRASKVANYTASVIILAILAWIWIDAFNDLPTFLGLISAGVAIALSDVLKNLAGWLYIMSRRPFRVSDRIEVDGTRGDVVDIRLFRFSLMEIGNWVDADQSTGRLVHIPNGILFTNQVANYTEGFEYIWHEIPVLITFESDRGRAIQIIKNTLRDRAPDVERSAGNRIRETARSYHIKVGALTPTVYLSVRDSGVLLTARLLVDPRTKRDVEQAIWTDVLEQFDAEAGVDLAYPTVRTYLHGPIALSQGNGVEPTRHSDTRT